MTQSKNRVPATEAPVALFAYNRAAQVERVVESLSRNRVSKLYAFCDGPKNLSDAGRTDEVRKLIRRIRWTDPEIVERPVNHGVRQSMLLGLEYVFTKESRVIVIEDDVSVAPEFCEFMSQCLERYRDDDRIAGVTGLRYPWSRSVLKDYTFDAFFSPRFSSWGWGTWKRWWQSIDFSHERMVDWISKTSDEALRAAGPDVPAMAHHLAEPGSSWGSSTADVYSLLHMVRRGQLFVCPTWNMIENLGFSDGTHSAGSTQSWSLTWEQNDHFPTRPLRLPADDGVPQPIWKALYSFLGSVMLTVEKRSRPQSRRRSARGLLKEITPPVVLRIVRALRERPSSLGRRPGRRIGSWPQGTALSEKPDPSEYTTANFPIEVPVQKEVYFLALNRYVSEGDRVLDVGCGVGYGLNLLSIKAREVVGVDVDQKAIDYCSTHVRGKNPKLAELAHYDGYHLPFRDKVFDVVTCVDVIEHVKLYEEFIEELLRVARKVVIFSTPNRRPEFSNPDGTPKNHWHLREWTFQELDEIVRKHVKTVDWNFVDGAWEGPFSISSDPNAETQSLVPALIPE